MQEKMELQSQIISQYLPSKKTIIEPIKKIKNNLIRATLYTLLGIIFALLGWNISQLIYLDIGGLIVNLIGENNLPFKIPSYVILLVIITPCLVLAMVIAEIFVSNPTRYKSNWRILKRSYLKPVLIIGFMAGIFLSILNLKLLASDFSSTTVRLLSWMVIGLVAGIADGLTWSFHSIESTSKKKLQRLIKSTFLGGSAGIIASTLFEIVRETDGKYQEPFGFFILGTCIGLALSFSARQSYQVALRAGLGFENIDWGDDSLLDHPRLQRHNNNNLLKFIPNYNNEGITPIIEEGISIQLPTNTSKPIQIQIGSSEKADIYIRDLPENCAFLTIESSQVTILCLAHQLVQIQRRLMNENDTQILRHNQIISLYPEEKNYEKCYRFVFYDRFLDPQG